MLIRVNFKKMSFNKYDPKTVLSYDKNMSLFFHSYDEWICRKNNTIHFKAILNNSDFGAKLINRSSTTIYQTLKRNVAFRKYRKGIENKLSYYNKVKYYEEMS